MGLTDPYLSRSEVTFETRARGTTRIRRLKNRRAARLRGTESPLRAGTKWRLGIDVWHARSRPSTLTWPQVVSRPAARLGRIGLVMMPVMLVVMAMRMGLPLPVLGVIATAVGLLLALFWLWRRHRWKQWDEARLLLVLSALTPSSQAKPPSKGPSPGTPNLKAHAATIPPTRRQGLGRGTSPIARGADGETSQVKVLRRPGRRSSITIPCTTRAPIAVVGNAALPYAQWVAAQMRVLGVETRVRGPRNSKAEPARDQRVDEDELVEVVWSETLATVPVNSALVLDAHPVGSPAWSQQVDACFRAEASLPARCEFVDLAASHGEGGAVPIGVSIQGAFSLDLPECGPHALVVGGTGSGKSEFLTTLVLAHALRQSPAELRIVLIDFKGGAGLAHLSGLPHVEHCLTDLDGAQVPWLLRSLSALLQRRKQLLQNAGARSWDEWDAAPARLHIIVDEFHVLAAQHPDLMEELVTIASQGRSLGFHLILATQRPSGSINAQMRATLDLRIALRCREAGDSMAAIGSAAAAELPRIPGRCLINGTEVQAAYVADCAQWVAKASDWGVRGASVIPAALPDSLDPQETTVPWQIGVLEVPGHGCEPLTLDRQNLAVVGPASAVEELSAIARTVAGLSNADSPAAGETVWIGEDDPIGPATRMLHATLQGGRRGRPTVVVDGVSGFFAKVEVAARPDLARELWKMTLAAARRGDIQLIATDTRCRYDFTTLPARLVRVPDRRALMSPDLAPYLPTVLPGSGGLPLARVTDLERFASPTPGRVLAQGFSGDDVVWAQVCLTREGTRTPRDVHGANSSVQSLPAVVAEAETIWLIGEEGVTVTVPDAAASTSPGPDPHASPARMGGASPAHPKLQVLRPDQWPTLAAHLGEVIVAVAPTAEVVRMLCQRHPDHAVWALASQPYRHQETLVYTPSTLQFYSQTPDPSGVYAGGICAAGQAEVITNTAD